jgi:tRNA-specific 2-thiouridylase
LAKKSRVIVGLSGGVDSSVAAFLLQKEGHEVIGVTMAIWDGQFKVTGKHACYGPDEQGEIEEAKEIADRLGIPHHVFDCSSEYKESVLTYFRSEYLSGRTPNPCVKCNQLIKFGLLPTMAEKAGIPFEHFATGHYARVELDKISRRYILKKGVDPRKDQTYFLYRLSQDQLSRILFPLGGFSKSGIRDIAKKAGIAAADKEESQDFYSGDYKELLEAEEKPGEIVDTNGNILGHHKGIWNYTIGQRRGLGIAFTEPLYVVDLNNETNRVVVGTRLETYRSSFIVSDLNWISVENIDKKTDVMCKIRSAQKEQDATIEPITGGEVRVEWLQPNDGITPGQSAVFYDGELVIGGGIIQSVGH